MRSIIIVKIYAASQAVENLASITLFCQRNFGQIKRKLDSLGYISGLYHSKNKFLLQVLRIVYVLTYALAYASKNLSIVQTLCLDEFPLTNSLLFPLSTKFYFCNMS